MGAGRYGGPGEVSKALSCGLARGCDKTLVIRHTRPDVAEVLPGELHALCECGGMFGPAGINEKIVR